MYYLSSEGCLAIIRTIVSIGLIIDCIECLFNAKHLERNGIYSGYIFKLAFKNGANKIDKYLRGYLSTTLGFKSLIVLKLVIIIMVNVPSSNLFHFYCFLSLFIIEILNKYRCQFGRDGSDQMDTIILASLTVAYLLKNEAFEILGIGFIAFQSCLSYITAGLAKLFSSVWTSGSAIVQILNAHSYGSPKTSAAILRFPNGKKIVCLSIIIFECVFPLSLLLPLNMSICLFVSGVIFHLLNALFMGLNKFFWSWVATYPAIFFSNQLLSNL